MSRKLSRRTVLRGAGVSLGLPWLEAMMPSSVLGATQPALPKRLAVLYMPNGINTKLWTPEGTGRDFKLSPTLEPLQPFKDQVTVISNCWNEAAKSGDGHYVKESAILTCCTISKTMGADLHNGVSLDQVAAQKIADQTPFPSLELGISPVATGVDTNVGYTRVYGGHITWRTPTTPPAREIQPRSVYGRLFRASASDGSSGKMDTLLLDRVLGPANQVRAQVGAADRIRIDGYLSVVGSLEQRLERAGSAGRNAWKPRVPISRDAAPPETAADYPEHVRLMLDMIALGFQTDT